MSVYGTTTSRIPLHKPASIPTSRLAPTLGTPSKHVGKRKALLGLCLFPLMVSCILPDGPNPRPFPQPELNISTETDTDSVSDASVETESGHQSQLPLPLPFPRPVVYTGEEISAEGKAEPVSLFPIETVWTTNLGDPPATIPAYDEQHVYVPLRNGTLSAIRLVDGELAWNAQHSLLFPPVAGDGMIIVSNKSTILSLRTSDATTIWSLELHSPISAPLLHDSGWLFVALETGELLSLRASDGHEFWRLPLDGPIRVQPSVAGTDLFVSTDDGRILAIDLLTGTQLWQRGLGGNPQKVLPLDSLYVGATDNYLYRLSRDNGTLEWRWRAGGDIVGSPVVNAQWVFFLSLDNILWALDRNSGVQQWRTSLPVRPRAGPSLVGETLLVTGAAPELRSFSSETGQPVITFPAENDLGAHPYIDESLSAFGLKMILTIADGRLVAMGPASSPPQFQLDTALPPPPLLPRPTQLELSTALLFDPLPALPTERAAQEFDRNQPPR